MKVLGLVNEPPTKTDSHHIDMCIAHRFRRVFAYSAYPINALIERALMGAMEAVTSTHKDLKRRATVICRHDEEILFVRKPNAKWNLPSGRVEKGETPLQAAMREMAEETSVYY